MEEGLMQGINKILAEAFKLVFHPTDTGVKSAFFYFMEIVFVETIHQRTLDSILDRSFDGLLQLAVLASPFVGKIGAQTPHPHVIPIKSLISGTIENGASEDKCLVASLSPLDIGFSPKAWKADSTIYERHRSRTAGKGQETYPPKRTEV